jgi:2-C-methyl-D-erythritol 4-phosphate cytidylyltransferase/2-C-methyl-D-erythritol 2,4-cyclodiphosphate synthase
MSVGVIVVAGGRGSRMGASRPKQFLEIEGKTLLRWSVEAFDRHPRVGVLVVVLPEDLVGGGAALVGVTERPCTIVGGGARRQDSVASGLAALPAGAALVLVHDAARPFADAALISRVIDAAERDGAAIPATAAPDTLKRAGADRIVRETIPRGEVWMAQTPQGFRRDVLERAVALGRQGLEATDEAMLVEAGGGRVVIVEGSAANVKLTTPEDLAAAHAGRPGGLGRVGTGYDLHRLADGRPLVLAGVTLDPGRGPIGHSDGDVVCHAAVDALLGAAGAGDIGRLFPDTDPVWRDAAGLDLLARALAVVAGRGWRVSNVDVTVVLERPKLAPHVEAIRRALAAALGVPADAVSVKGKTNEGVDAVGRGEAIVAHAVASLVPARIGP